MEEKDIKEPISEETAPKKRKLKKWHIALICVAAFIVLVGLAVGIFFIVGAINSRHRVPLDGKFDNAAPDFEVSYTEEELAMIEVAMSDDATDAEIKAAISMIYNKANDNKINHTENAVAVLRGEGSATLNYMGLTPSGSMIVRGIKVQSGKEFYYQKAAPIMECSEPSLQSTLDKMLSQQERTYTDGVSQYYGTGTLKGKKAKIQDVDDVETLTIPFILVDLPDAVTKFSRKGAFKEEDTFYDSGFYLEDPREITNFRVTADAIVLKPLEEGQKYIELVTMEDGAKYYVCRFSLDIHNESCVEVARAYLRKSAESGNLQYLQFDVIMEVWDNGYLKKMHDDEQWTGSAVVGNTTSTSWYETIVYYDYDETLIEESERAYYLGDDEGASWASKMIKKYKDELMTIETVNNK